MQETLFTTSDENPVQPNSSALLAEVGSSNGESLDSSCLRSEENTSETSQSDTKLVSMLQTEARLHRRHTLYTFGWAGALLLAIKLMVARLETDTDRFSLDLKICFALLFSVGGVLLYHLMRRSYRNKKSLSEYIKQGSDKSQVGSLIRALRVDSAEVKRHATLALIKLLPQMNASDASLFGDEERVILTRILSISPYDKGPRDLTELWSRAAEEREIALRVSILKALEQVGGEKELLSVARLAKVQPPPPSMMRMPAVITEAAQQCLPYLQTRADEQLAGRQLLRASSSDAVTAASLLRAVESSNEAAPDQLLRATNL